MNKVKSRTKTRNSLSPNISPFNFEGKEWNQEKPKELLKNTTKSSKKLKRKLNKLFQYWSATSQLIVLDSEELGGTNNPIEIDNDINWEDQLNQALSQDELQESKKMIISTQKIEKQSQNNKSMNNSLQKY